MDEEEDSLVTIGTYVYVSAHALLVALYFWLRSLNRLYANLLLFVEEASPPSNKKAELHQRSS